MGWFSPKEEEPVTAYDYSNEFEDEPLENDCTIQAVQVLTGNYGWRPREVVDHIRRHSGLLTNAFNLIAKHAPVTSHEHSEITVDRESGNITIESENGVYHVQAYEQIVITYNTSPGRAHAECINVDEFEYYAQTHDIRHIFTKDQ